MCVCAYRHVRGTSSTASFCFRIHQSSANAEITQLDLPFVIQQDIRWLNVSVNHTVFLFQVKQSFHDLNTRGNTTNIIYVRINLATSNCKKADSIMKRVDTIEFKVSLTATVMFPRMASGMGPWILFFSFSAHVPISSMAMNTSVYRTTKHVSSSNIRRPIKICRNSQRYIAWVEIIHFSLMPKLIGILSERY